MSDFHMDLVIVRIGREFPEVYQAPSFSGIRKGDAVVVETEEGDATGIVDSVITVHKTYDKEMLKFMMLSAGCKEPLKRVRYRIKYVSMEYADEADCPVSAF